MKLPVALIIIVGKMFTTAKAVTIQATMEKRGMFGTNGGGGGAKSIIMDVGPDFQLSKCCIAVLVQMKHIVGSLK